MSDLDPNDRDALIRTVIGEAGNQGPEGMAAVANSVMNRVASGRYGDSPAAVVLQPGQYEPWQTRRQELLSINPRSQAYQQAGQVVDAVASGDVPDSTNGSTHFLQKETVLQRRGSLPAWASKPNAQVGAHTFYSPEGKASYQDGLSAINNAIGEPPPTPGGSAALAYDDTNPGGLFSSAGYKVPGAKPASSQTPAADSSTSQGMFEAAGYRLPGTLSPTQAVQAPDTSWKDAEAQANLAAQGDTGPARTWGDVASDVTHAIGNISLTGMIKGIATGAKQAAVNPGNILASKTPSTSESLIPGAVNMAGFIDAGGAGAAKAVAPLQSENQVINRLTQAIGPENVPAAIERLKANPRLTLADVSEPVRDMAAGLAADPAQPAAQRAVTEAVKQRAADALEATNDAYSKAMGPNPDVPAYVAQLKDRAKAVGKEAIQPALDNAKLVDTSPVIAAIDGKLTPGVNRLMGKSSELPMSDLQKELAQLKDQLVTGDGEQLFDANRLHRVQSDFGDRAYEMSQSSSGKERADASGMRAMNEQLVDAIDKASGGTYRPAREKFRTEKQIEGAFDEGFDTLKARQGKEGALTDSPEGFKSWVDHATPEEVVARRLGTRADIARRINSVKNGSLAGENLVASDWAQQKLKMLFSDDEAGRLIRNMQDAKDIRTTNNSLQGGSQTAARLSGQKALAVPKVGGGNPLQLVAPVAAELIGQSAGLPGVGAAASIGLKGLHMAGQKAAQMSALARNAEFAKAAMATGGQRQILMNRLTNKIVPQAGNAVSRGATRATPGGLAIASAQRTGR